MQHTFPKYQRNALQSNNNHKNFDYKKKSKCLLSTKKYLTFYSVSEKWAQKKRER